MHETGLQAPEEDYLALVPWIDALAEHFVDARFVACVRHPQEAVPSQVNAMLIGARLFSARVRVHWWREGLTNMLAHYGDVLMQAQQSLPKTRMQVIDMRTLSSSPQDVVIGLHRHFGWPLSAEYRQRLTEHDRRARQYRSGHHYNSEALGIHQQDIERQFARFIDHFHLSASTTHRLQSN